MDIITKMQVDVPRETVFEAFVDPEKIGGFWFSSSSLLVLKDGKKVRPLHSVMKNMMLS